ncbi:ATP-binding protein [Candidatus Gottesmanbacteria bacterium]|nr:ATP-binding protein [Candidatus Gottesmanbacteria bacterium]
MYIQRNALDQLKRHLSQKEISLILGPRQSGKTTLILKLKEELEKQGKRTAYYNLDRLEDLELFATQKNLLEKIKFEFGEEKIFVFIDEIQRLKNAGLFLKGLFDYLSPHKFIVTGSGSLELKENIVEPLTGRKKVFYLYPLSFEEFFNYKTAKKLKDFLRFYQFNKNGAERLLDEYLVFGGYPKVVLAKTTSEKQEVLQEIYSSYLEKDVKALLGVEKDLIYQHLLKYLAGEAGSLFKKSEVSRNLGLNIKTLNRYLFLLEKTYVIKIVRPFYKNPTKELVKTPKVYFLDLGLRNFMISRLNSFFQRDDRGKIFENFVFRQILDKAPMFGVWFWRTETSTEVDFILQEKGGILPIEVKNARVEVGTVGKNILAFLTKYRAKKAVIVHWGEEKIFKRKDIIISYKKIIL